MAQESVALLSDVIMVELNWFEIVYTAIGGLGIFFIGMKNLSEALQAVAGNLIRRIINALTTNRFMAVLVGAGVTVLIQSSSVTTVMVIGFVNAGLMELGQAIGVILGANIGTTITGWIIAIKIGKYGLLLVGVGALPVIFAKRRKAKNIGNILVGLGLVFMGLEAMSAAFRPLRGAEGFLELMQYFAADDILSLWACIIVGTLLTFLIQSSSAMLGITIAMAVPGAITYQTAVALVLGQNIGTTITAMLASVGTSSAARRAARAHALFNIFGAIAFSLFFWIYIDGVDALIGGEPDAQLVDGSKPYIAAHIAAAHTIFNVATSLLFLPFLAPLARFVTWITPAPDRAETPHLQYLPSVSWSSPSMAIIAAEQELRSLARVVWRMFQKTRDYVVAETTDDDKLEELHQDEAITDSIQAEITMYVCKIQENRLTETQSAEAYSIIRAADELESIADYCEAIGRYRNNLDRKGERLSEEAQMEFQSFFDRICSFYNDVYEDMRDDVEINLSKIRIEGKSITEKANRIRSAHRRRLETGVSTPVSGMFFTDMVVALRKIRGHTINLAEAISRVDVTEVGD